MQSPDTELGTIRAHLAFHRARVAHVALERNGTAPAGGLGELLQREREQFTEGSLECRVFDAAAAEPWSDFARRLPSIEPAIEPA